MKIMNCHRRPHLFSGNGIARLSLVCLLVTLVTGCSKEEFMPPAEGKQVPYVDTLTIGLKDALAQSPAKLFYQAWQRSNMEAALSAVGEGKGDFTILALSDEALLAGGYTAQRIQTMAVSELDSLLLFYTLRGRITNQALTNRDDNLIATSLLKNPRFRAMADPDKINPNNPNSFYTYYYKQHLQVKDGKTYVNGKPAGNGRSIAAKNGYIFMLDHMVAKPDKTLLQVMEASPQFSMLLELMRRKDTLYNKIYFENTGYESEFRNPTTKSSSQRFGWEIRWNAISNEEEDVNLIFNTTFLPTNDAFRAAGFNTVDDLMAFNEKRGLPYYEFWSMNGNFATDSLLDMHLNWGALHISQYGLSRMESYPVFYSNMLLGSAMPKMVIREFFRDPNDPNLSDETYYMPLEFSKDAAGRTLVKVKGSDAPPATLVEPDIPTLMGPIQAVDRLLIPKGFKLN